MQNASSNSVSAAAAARFNHSSKPSASDTGFSHGAFNSNNSGFAERLPRRGAPVPAINTNAIHPHHHPHMANNHEMTPGTAFDFTPLLPSQLLLGSPFQPGTPAAFSNLSYQSSQNPIITTTGAATATTATNNNSTNVPMAPSPTAQSPNPYQMVSPSSFGAPQYIPSHSPALGYTNPPMASMATAPMSPGGAPVVAPGSMSGSRTVYLGNVPADTSAEELLSHVRSGQIESVRMLPDKNCAFISFLDPSSATHFHSDAILKKLCIKGQDIKIGWGKASPVPTSVALAVQQSGASRNVYLGSLPDSITDEELREDMGKFGAIDTIKLVKEKNIAFVHYLSISNAIKAVTQLPQEAKWQAPRRVFYGKDRCAYVSKTQQQNAAQYLGIAPSHAHMLTGADRDVISNALAQQSMAAAAVATAAGGMGNLGNRTVYLGNIHPETTLEEICNVVRGGLLHHIRYIPDKHICFVTFIDPTAAASFFALSNLQGLMIHNRRLKIGWGKHSGGLPPAIALAVSGGASRNVYIGNLDESWTEERLRQDFSEYGEIELVNTLREKSCAFVNFTNIANAIKAIEAARSKDEYRKFKVNFGKDRCGNPPRHLQAGESPKIDDAANSTGEVQDEEPSVPGASQPTSVLFHHQNNPLTLYLNQVVPQPQAGQFPPPQPPQGPSPQLSQTQSQHGGFSNSGTPTPHDLSMEVTPPPPGAMAFPPSLTPSPGPPTSMANGAPTLGGLLAPGGPRGQHNRAVSLPVLAPGFENAHNGSAGLSSYTGLPIGNGSHGGNGVVGGELQQQRRGHQYQASFSGIGNGFGGLAAVQNGGNFGGWMEEEVAN